MTIPESPGASPTTDSFPVGGHGSDGAETDTDTLLEENAPSPAVVSASGWARVRGVQWDAKPYAEPDLTRSLNRLHQRRNHANDSATDGASVAEHARPRSRSRSRERVPRIPPRRQSTDRSTRGPPSRKSSAGTVEGPGGQARQRSEVQGSEQASSLVNPSDRNPASPYVHMPGHPAGVLPSSPAERWSMTPSMPPSNLHPYPHSPWAGYFPQHGHVYGPRLPASVHASAMPVMGQHGQSIPSMPPYPYHPNWSHADIYHDIAVAAGLGMGTPFQSGTPVYPSTTADLPMPSVPLGTQPARDSHGSVVVEMSTPRSVMHDLEIDIERCARSARGAAASVWKPTWQVFGIKAFRGRKYKVIAIEESWDDEQLLIALNHAYQGLRGWFLRWFSLKCLSFIIRVKVNDAYIYPQRVGPGRTTAHRNMRMRYLLEHPDHMRGKYEFMRVLTESAEYGVEFVERWDMARVCTVVIGSALLSLSIAVVYGCLAKDWSTGFQIACKSTCWCGNHPSTDAEAT
ncbi:hypothetical protein FKP32DRAFT_1588345 [Trametes sanguinea]|nr:hypothetical protein FKP32DRAFT_1588345 [Trametes sanguinea]